MKVTDEGETDEGSDEEELDVFFFFFFKSELKKRSADQRLLM